MNSYSFGEDLAQARELNGLTISQASEALRIRRSVIIAIEQGNFASLPAKGFARNQISAYARFLGLDSADIVSRFLQEYSVFESTNSSSRIPVNESQRYKQKQMDETVEFHKVPQRVKRQNGIRKDLANYHVLPDSNPDETSRMRAAKHDGAEKRSGESQSYGVKGKILGNDFSQKGYPPSRRKGKTSGISVIRNRIILIALIVILAAVVIFLVPRCVCASPDAADASAGSEQTQGDANASGTVPVSGIENSDMKVMADDATDAGGSSIAAPVESFNLLVAAKEGISTYMEINIDGKTIIADDIKGPINETYAITKSATITSGTKKNVSLSINGVTVPFKSSGDMYRAKLTVKNGKVVIS